MSTPPAMHMSSAAMPAPRRAAAKKAVSMKGLTITGVWLFAVGLLVVGSGYKAMRPNAFGLSLHPFLPPLMLAAPFVILSRIGLFPVRVLVALIVFATMYCLAMFGGGSVQLGEIVKILSAPFTIISCALLVRKRGDFLAGVLGLNLAMVLLAWNGLTRVGDTGLNPMETANKNSYSLFALPSMLAAGFIGTRMKDVPVWVKNLLVACTVPVLAVIFMSGNRSGYLGSLVVAMLLFWNRMGRGLLVVGLVATAVMIWITQFGTTEYFTKRMERTFEEEGIQGDQNRIDHVFECTEIALSNPVIGVSPKGIGFDPHNVFGYVAAGTGLICFTAMLAVAFTLCTLKPANGRKLGGKDDPARQAVSLLRMLMVLWAVRGMFTREILYNPPNNIVIGLAIGLFILAQFETSDGETKSSPSQLPIGRPPGMPPA